MTCVLFSKQCSQLGLITVIVISAVNFHELTFFTHIRYKVRNKTSFLRFYLYADLLRLWPKQPHRRFNRKTIVCYFSTAVLTRGVDR